MADGRQHAAVLDDDHAAFIQGGVSIVVATRDADLVPDAVRGCGCRVSRDRRNVTVLIESLRIGPVVANIEANGMIAVVFSQPSTHRTVQLKGTDARVVRVASRDRGLVERNLAAWIDELTAIGYGPEFARAVHGSVPDAMVALVFTPTAAFQQTPGPGAGDRLRS